MTSLSDIARLWAEQAPKGPCTAGNFWRNKPGGIRENVAGHHGTGIARLVKAPSGETIALVMDSHWGNGTAAFINCCDHEAKKAGFTTFRVPYNTPDHGKNLLWFEKQALDCEAKIPKAKTVDWQAKADAIRQEAQRYRQTFGI